ncbi:hypothetical protein Aros01_07504 [Streptosporangium roseum]
MYLRFGLSDYGVGDQPGGRSGVGVGCMRAGAAERGATCVIGSPPEGGTVVEAVLPLNLNVEI